MNLKILEQIVVCNEMAEEEKQSAVNAADPATRAVHTASSLKWKRLAKNYQAALETLREFSSANKQADQ